MSLILAGLDIATVTGLALKNGKTITTSTFRAEGKKRFLDNEKDKSIDAKRMGMAGRSFEDFLTAWLISNGVQHVAIEAPLPSNFERKKVVGVDPAAAWAGRSIAFEKEGGAPLATWFKIYGLAMQACTVCARLNIPAVFVNQSTWRRAFLGNGRPKDSKKESRAMCKRLGIECSSDDAAEAVGIVHWLDVTLNPYGGRANDLFKVEASA